jgi:glucokinase
MSYYAGFDLGGTLLKYGLIDGSATLVFHDKVATPEKISELLKVLGSIWKDLKKREWRPIQKAGFGFPGIFSQKEQKIFQSPNYADIDNFDLRPALIDIIDVPFSIHNDANMAAYGEYKAGAGKGTKSMVLLTLGTGVGSGVILDGNLWLGHCGFAGELGHITVNPEGDTCNCGSRGCLETEASALKIVKDYKTKTGTQPDISSEEIFHKAQDGDTAAREVFIQAGKYLGIGLAAIINFINPEKILLGGGLMNAKDILLPAALEEARKRSYAASFACCKIEPAVLGNKAGIIGSAVWAKENY